jgi:septal ring-binding cell division protein DamX
MPPRDDAKRSAKPATVPVATPLAAPVPTVAAAPQKPDPEPAQPVSKLDKSIAGTNSQIQSETKDEVELRMAAAKEWLAQSGKNSYSIQLLGADNPTQLKHHLNVIRKYVEINDIFVYRTVAKQKPSLTVLYGTFGDRQAAQQALAKLPAPLNAYKPVVRTRQGIRAEIAQHQSS